MNRWTRFGTLAVSLSLSTPQAASNAELKEEVRATERAFAKTMADRDAAAFATFLLKDTVFMFGGQALRGPAEVAKAWQKYFSGPAPFSWEPENVEVVGSGNLAMSSGPVRDPSGKRTGTFNATALRGPRQTAGPEEPLEPGSCRVYREAFRNLSFLRA